MSDPTQSSSSSSDTAFIPNDISTADDRIDNAIMSDDLEQITDCVTEIVDEHDRSNQTVQHDSDTPTT